MANHTTRAQRVNARQNKVWRRIDNARQARKVAEERAQGWNIPLERLRYHVTGAIERGEAKPIVGKPTTDNS